VSCKRRDLAVMERYLHNRLTRTEREAFERHLFDCPECAEELETLETIREALRRMPPEPVAHARFSWTRLLAPLAAAAAIAAVAVGIWKLTTSPTATSDVATPPPLAHTESPPAPSSETPEPITVEPKAASVDLLALAEIRPPEYSPAVLRGVTGAADASFRRAMELYRAGDYAAAIPGLRAVVDGAPADPRPAFYLGASYLLVGELDLGMSTLDGVVALGDTAYLEDTLLLQSKVHIRRSELRSAQERLREVIDLEGDRETEARRLLDAVRTHTSQG